MSFPPLPSLRAQRSNPLEIAYSLGIPLSLTARNDMSGFGIGNQQTQRGSARAPSESVNTIRQQIDWRRSCCNEISNDLPRRGGADQAKEPMAESKERVCDDG
jgi:hypothetical protein